MANNNFEVDTGISVRNSTGSTVTTIDAVAGDITTSGNLTLSSTSLSYTANTVTPKSYVDVMSVVFGS